MNPDVLIETPDGLFCPAGDFYIDPWGPVERAVITHAHGDHARPGSARLSLRRTVRPLLRAALRIRGARSRPCPTASALTHRRRRRQLPSRRARARLGADPHRGRRRRLGRRPATTSARADPTCAPFEPVRCDTFITESTFGLPIYRWDPTATVDRRTCSAGGRRTRAAGRAVGAVLLHARQGAAHARRARDADRPTGARPRHDAADDRRLSRRRRRDAATVAVVTERPRGTSFAGELVLAPLVARGTPWMRRLGDASDAFASGLMRVRGVRRQRAFDRGFVLSDHADWPALLADDRRDRRARVLATHGHAEPLARYLREQGLEAGVIRTAWEGERTGGLN